MDSPLQRQAEHNSPMQNAANASPQVTQLMAMQDAANQSQQVSAQADLQEGANAGGGLTAPGLEAGSPFSDEGEEIAAMIDQDHGDAVELEDEGPEEVAIGPEKEGEEVMQRAAFWDSKNKYLVKKGRHSFATLVQNGMGLKSNQARCHVISYETICAGVIDVINEVLKGKGNIFWAESKLEGLLYAVYPNGGKTSKYSGNQDLDKAAKKYYKIAKTNIKKIILLLRMKKLNKKRRQEMRAYVNLLIKSLNNSPDNLRPGNSSTNSSIGSSLDLIQTGTRNLKKGTRYTYDGVNFKTLKKKKKVIKIDDTNAKSVKTLLTDTWSQSGELSVFSSGSQLQSSEKNNMKAGNMTTKNPTPLSIPWGTDKKGNPTYRFFET